MTDSPITLPALLEAYPDGVLKIFPPSNNLLRATDLVERFGAGDLLDADSKLVEVEICIDRGLSVTIGWLDDPRPGGPRRGVQLHDRYAEYHPLPGITTMPALVAFVAALRTARGVKETR